MKDTISGQIGLNLQALIMNKDLSTDELRISSETLLILAFEINLIEGNQVHILIDLLSDYIESGYTSGEARNEYHDLVRLFFLN